jgi:hypothetical protein
MHKQRMRIAQNEGPQEYLVRESKERSRSSSTSCVVSRCNLCITYLICRFSRRDERYDVGDIEVGERVE